VVADEPALLGSEPLHLGEQLGVALLGDVETEFLALDPDRIEPALLSEHDRPLRADQLGRVRLDRRRIVELARDGAALAPEEVLSDDGLPRLERRSRDL